MHNNFRIQRGIRILGFVQCVQRNACPYKPSRCKPQQKFHVVLANQCAFAVYEIVTNRKV